MPSSTFSQINKITQLIHIANPKKILDIGIGCGKYAFLSREYLDKPYESTPYKIIIHGVEAHQEYITPIHELLYDKIFKGDFLITKNQIDDNYDLILLIDVIEHFNREDGINLINFLLKRTKNLLIATPDGFIEQEEVYNNPYEIHKSGWSKTDFSTFQSKFFINHESQLIVLLGSESQKIKKIFSQENKFVTLKTIFPFIKKPYWKLKKLLTPKLSK